MFVLYQIEKLTFFHPMDVSLNLHSFTLNNKTSSYHIALMQLGQANLGQILIISRIFSRLTT